MSQIGLPKGMSRDDAYVQGVADGRAQIVALLDHTNPDHHIPSITDEIEGELVDLVFNSIGYADGADTADLALRICHCGKRIDGFYEYVDHLKEVFA